jgi:hypothetical protein
MSEQEENKEESTKGLSTEGLVKRLVKGKIGYDTFAKKFDSEYLIDGKTAAEWRAEFDLKIPPDCNTSNCIDINTKLMKFHQRATYYKSKAENRVQGCKGAGDAWYRSQMVRQITLYQEKGQRLPSKDTMAAVAEESMGDVNDYLIHANIALSFWKDMLADIREARKNIENIAMNLSVEAKALQHEQQINSLGRRYTTRSRVETEEYPNE